MYLNAKTIYALVNDAQATGKLVQAQKAGGKWVTSTLAVVDAIAQLTTPETDAEQLEKSVTDYLYTYYVDIRDLPPVTKLAPAIVEATQQNVSLNDALDQACAAYYEVEQFDLDTAPELVETPVEETAPQTEQAPVLGLDSHNATVNTDAIEQTSAEVEPNKSV